MKTQAFDYKLPQELIAQQPAPQRDESRLLVYRRKEKVIEHRRFSDIGEYLQPGDALVVNETQVLPARLVGQREDTGGAMEMLLLRRLQGDVWEVLAGPSRRAQVGRHYIFGNELRATVKKLLPEGRRVVEFTYDGVFAEVLDRVGALPLPPYIHEPPQDKDRYQTVYARVEGSAAAPTAGLHFTPMLLEQLAAQGVNIIRITLHVGLGTFRPVKAREVNGHTMHAEYYEVSETAAQRLNAVRAAGGRWVCVGTTSVRTLESVTDEAGRIHAGCGWTDIFIYPGYRFKAADALVTNFHLPQSTLLMMISALDSREGILNVYNRAVEEKYRFFSFGDAMLIL